ncbi:hypothetical protein HCN44_005208 [Aphidius gifuensis]|uniref:UBX domain-containing protein n=1 Tax=Aphidius gifuensis TaxID=684658 RepID=A0A835CQH3_APHGI|nr:UBX domain-containing protein 1 [Aphidius gifuensis]KAF7992864.1 hypothetical protein HCN44_005208 [Aphidius gifuensis]
MSSSELTMLVDMGFSQIQAEKAIKVTGNKGLEQAMEWLLANPGNVDTAEQSTDDTSNVDASSQDNNGASVKETAEAKSLKCDVCGKLFKSSLEVEFHATKSGHDKFSESTEEKKPLTEEEKKEKLKLLEEKMRQKRKEREDEEKAEAIEKEKSRIMSGKAVAEARRKMEDLEMKKILEQRKRDKEEDRIARERVKKQIEADKAARRAKAAAESGAIPAPVVSPVQAAPSFVPAQKRDYTETKLQIRLTNGESLTQTFGVKEPLSAVKVYVEMNRTDLPGAFNLMTTFPRKVFNDDDYDTPLDVLGLVPAAVVIVQKKTEQ